MQIVIEIPNNFVPEREYTIACMLRYFEGVSWSFKQVNQNQTQFLHQEKPFLVVQDAFWQTLDEKDFDYKNLAVPEAPVVFDLENQLFQGKITSIYGTNKFSYDDGCLILHADIIASAFFLLTRWEEYALPNRDAFDRFPDEASFLFKNKLTHRPLVNEYIAFLKTVLGAVSNTEIQYNRKYSVHITHDIDEIYRFSPISKFFKALGGDLIIRKSLKQFFQTIAQKIRIRQGKEKDPSDTFDYLMESSEKHQLISSFYFIPGEKGEKDFRYSISDSAVKKIIQSIHTRGHIVGIHPSLETNGNAKSFAEEVKRLTEVSRQAPKTGRQHYLAFQVPFTWRFWEENNLAMDSSLGYRTCAGFRAGMCYAYPVFDILQRKELTVQELPLTFMEVALTNTKVTPEEFEKIAEDIANTVKKYQGDFVLLWHNNNIYHPFYATYGERYESIIKKVSGQKHLPL
jgi:hypothetical protein